MEFIDGACVSIMRMHNGQFQVMLGDLHAGKFTPTRVLGCVPPNRIPDPPIVTLSDALRLIADTLESEE